MRSSHDESAIDDLLEVWFARRHEGRPIDVDELCAEAPHLRDVMARVIRRHMALIEPIVAAPDRPSEADPGAAELEAAPALPPQLERLADYRIKKRIGRGGIGEVYLARQESLDRLVAIKVLGAGFAADTAYRLRFRREAEITAALDHPHIVPVYETGEDDGVLFLVMKLIDGVSIDRAAASGDVARLATMGANVARALHAAHGVGVVHRDVKPANVLVAGDHPFVVDFGLARGAADVSLTRPGQSPGTLQFMAPEQIRGGAPSVDARVDVYGLGATLFQCLHGRPPFDASDPPSLLQQILFEDPPKLRVTGRARDLDVIARRALHKEPERRFASALELAEDLERLAAGEPIHSRPVGPVERFVVRARRYPRATAAIACAVVVSLVLAIGFWRAVADAEARQREQVELARGELLTGYPSRARARLLELPAARRAEPDARELSARIETRLRLEALLDQLQAERRFRDAEFLEELQREMLRGDPSVVAGKPAWIAQVMLADYGGRKTELQRLLRDERARAFPRAAALLAAPPDAVARALERAGDAADPADAALDAVAVSSLLRTRELDPALIAAELERPVEYTARLIFGKAMVELILDDESTAAALLAALLQDGRPHPEAHMALARIAGRNGRLDAARRHLARARSDLEAAARATPLRLVLAEAEVELMHGDVERCRERLAVAGEGWPGRPEITLVESHLAALDGDLDRALALSADACANDPLPWTWRRATAHWLALRLERALRAGGSAAEVGAIAADARELRRRSRAAFDTTHEARAENILAFLASDPEQYVAGLERVLELEPGDPAAALQFVEQVWAWVEAGQPLEGRLRQRAERAVELVEAGVRKRRAAPRALSDPQFVKSTLDGARIAARLGDIAAAKRLGAAVHGLLQRHPDRDGQAMLEALARELGIDDWPE